MIVFCVSMYDYVSGLFYACQCYVCLMLDITLQALQIV